MPVVPPTKLAQLQNNVDHIRNVCVLAHVDHGKTTLSDALLATNAIISNKLAGKVRYLDSREDEQERGITMESSGISLYYKLIRKQDDEDKKSVTDTKKQSVSEYLINLIDSPGHVDFASEVASAARLSDGALVLVDVVEGVCTQTVSVLRQAWVEKVQPVLFLNKIDRLIVEWQMTPAEAYVHMQQLVEQVNAVLAGFWEGDRLSEDSRNLEEAKEKWKETHGDDAPMTEWYLEEKDDSHIYFSPEQGNVLFGSAIDGWAFRINHFAQIFADKMGIPSPEKLQPLMWGDYFIDPKNKKRVLTRKQYTKLYGSGKAAAAIPLFVQLCLMPIWQVYESVIVEPNQEKVDKVISALDIKVLPRDRRSKDRRVLLTAIMQGWLPLAQACMIAIVEQLPSPAHAQPIRLPHLISGASGVSMDQGAVEPKDDVERALYGCDSGNGSDSSSTPLVAYIGKVISIPRETLPEFGTGGSRRDRMTMSADEMRAMGREAIRQGFGLSRDSPIGTPFSELPASGARTPGSGTDTPFSSNQDQGLSLDSLADMVEGKLGVGSENGTPPTEDTDSTSDPDATDNEILVGFGRIYSGTIRTGDTIWAMQPKFDAKKPGTQKYLKQVTVRALYMMMGRELVSLQEVPAGNIFGIRGISGAIIKSGTLANDPEKCPNLAAMHTETHPIVRVALEPVNPQDMSKLARGLELLNQADPCTQVILQSTGERILVTAGELHLERCLKDLRERFARCEVHVSEPIVPFREGIVRLSAQSNVILGEIGSSGQSLALISNEGMSEGNPEASSETEEYEKEKIGTEIPRGEVTLTTPNGLVTITLQVEPLPQKATEFLMRHERDVRRVVDLMSSSQRRRRLAAVAESLEQSAATQDSEDQDINNDMAVGDEILSDNEDDGVEDPTSSKKMQKPSKVSELGPWIQERLRACFKKSKGWEPQRVESITDSGIRSFGPQRTGPNVLIYNKEMLEQANKQDKSLFATQTRFLAGSSSAATPRPLELNENDADSGVNTSTSLGRGESTGYTIRDFEESINSGFQLATRSGPLCFEPLIGAAVTVKRFMYNHGAESNKNYEGTNENAAKSFQAQYSQGTSLSGQIISLIRDAVKTGFLAWSPRLHLAMYTCDIQATSEVLGKVYSVISRRRGRILSEEMREGTPYFTIKAAIPIVESFGFADEIRKRTSGAAIPLLIFRGFEPLDIDPFWVPTTEEELEDLGEKADRENVAKKYMDKVRKRKGLFVERKIIEHAEKQRTLKK